MTCEVPLVKMTELLSFRNNDEVDLQIWEMEIEIIITVV